VERPKLQAAMAAAASGDISAMLFSPITTR
jgi:hypothetical protein